jgi:putative tricarboxylic transport membrane protein
LGLLLLWHCGAATAAEWRPERNVEVVVGTAAGSSQDRNARRAQKIWQENRFFTVPQVIVNKPGGGGELGWTYLAQFAGDGHYISMTSPSMFSNQLLGKSRQTLSEVTPLALLVREYETFSVRAEHGIKSMSELAERLRKDPASITFGYGVAVGNAQHATGALYGKALRVDPRAMKMVVFNASAEAMTAVMGGHVDVLITTGSGIEQHVRGGKLRVLGVAAPARLEGTFAGVPTFKETGVDIVFSNWNGAVGTKNMTAAQIAFWDGIFAKTTATPEWKKAMADAQQDATYLGSQQARIFMERERDQYRNILTDLGLIK